MSKTLAGVADAKTLKLTTTGRKSGQPRTAEIWFVVEADHLFIQAGKAARKGWLVNIKSNPQVALDIAGTRLRGRATVITDSAQREHVLDLIRQKYWRARISSWIGSAIGAGIPVRIDDVTGG
ncbi:MAG TPA: nitroreductase family deazaflavin-dependent oxidoreductase [Candidatus Kryptonia bacterium]|nr:nitroreductase family deazaflavin-dependent oxidoreductase [Candidatus Kryptonia bacterium]